MGFKKSKRKELWATMIRLVNKEEGSEKLRPGVERILLESEIGRFNALFEFMTQAMHQYLKRCFLASGLKAEPIIQRGYAVKRLPHYM